MSETDPLTSDQSGSDGISELASLSESGKHGSGALLQAIVFVEDAVNYRSIAHKVDVRSLRYYRFYYSKPVQWTLYLTIFIVLALAFFETPSSLTTKWNSHPCYTGERLNPPCWLTESIELLCLLIFLCDLIGKCYLMGLQQTLKSKWLLAYMFILAVSFLDCFFSLGYHCTEPIRVRRYLRPFFLLQKSTLLKKTVRSIKRTMPEIISVLLLLMLHIFFFTIIGMLLFSQARPNIPDTPASSNSTTKGPNLTTLAVESSNSHSLLEKQDPLTFNDSEGNQYFKSLDKSLINLLVLLTTANNPDVMMPAYSVNRFYALYFIVFLLIGLYCFLNILTAVVYNQFRGYLQYSVQASYFRRRLGIRAAFEVLRWRSSLKHTQNDSHTVSLSTVRSVVVKSQMAGRAKKAILKELNKTQKESVTAAEFRHFFTHLDTTTSSQLKPPMWHFENQYLQKVQWCIAHRYFNYLGNAVALVNVVCITVELGMKYSESLNNENSQLAGTNFIFIIYYVFEQVTKILMLGWRRYFSSRSNAFDFLITIILLVIQITDAVYNGVPFSHQGTSSVTLLYLLRIINMLIMFRLLRIIPQFKTFHIVAGTLFGLLKNLRAFAGLLVVIYYVFAILGLQLFSGKIVPPCNSPTRLPTYKCGTYEELNYWANNFDDFAAALVVLWDAMVVNNWHIFLIAYSKYTSPWSQLYFIAWYFVSVLVCINLFTALILENFISKWEANQHEQLRQRERRQESGPDHPPQEGEGEPRLRADSGDSDQDLMRSATVHDMFRNDLQEPDEDEILKALEDQLHLGLGPK